MVINTAQLHSTKPELRFCAGSNPARGVSEICNSEDLWQWSRPEIRLNAFRRSTIQQNNSSSSSSSSSSSMLKKNFSLNQWSLFSIHENLLRLQFSHLNEHKFRHNFKDCVSPMFNSSAETETTSHFFFCCQFYANERQKLRDDIYRIDTQLKT